MKEVFIPDLIPTYRLISLAVVLALAGLFLLWAGRGRFTGGRRALLQMGSGLVIVFGLGVAGMLVLSLRTRPTIVVSPEQLLLGNEAYTPDQVEKAYVEQLPQQSWLGPTSVKRVAVIQMADRPPLVLSEDEYQIDSVVIAIRRASGD